MFDYSKTQSDNNQIRYLNKAMFKFVNIPMCEQTELWTNGFTNGECIADVHKNVSQLW